MPDVATANPAFRAWLDSLKVPSFFDKDALLAAGVIEDDEDWLLWRDRGWLAFIIKATDAQQVALFGLVRGPSPAGRPVLIRAWTKFTCPRGHFVGVATKDIYGANVMAGLRGDVFRAEMVDLADDQPALVGPHLDRGIRGGGLLCRCGAPWGWLGSVHTEAGWCPPIDDDAERQLEKWLSQHLPADEARSEA